MDQINIKVQTTDILADTQTPVGIYLRVRDVFPQAILLESSDYRAMENSYSFICMDPVAHFILEKEKLLMQYPDGAKKEVPVDHDFEVTSQLSEFIRNFSVTGDKSPVNGLFGYFTYDSVQFFEQISFKEKTPANIPLAYLSFFRVIIAVNHFQNKVTIIENIMDGYAAVTDKLLEILQKQDVAAYRFYTESEESSNLTDAEYINYVKEGKKACQRGDVFQIVLSRRFSQSFKGDDFNVYRNLRSINPSPYLFYFDYGNFKLFGSSPEAQLIVKDGRAIINPIAGTFRRTGNDRQDVELAERLREDEKENAEHVMLVDLARNDLSKYCDNVIVDQYKEIQYYSHVLHLVSKVSGKLKNPLDSLKVFAGSFPAGTLSGAPKFRAMEIIDGEENINRGYYGGSIGYVGFNGDINQAIMIRSFLSKNNTLHYQAGAGIVSKSSEENELQEVNNKLMALKKAIELAKNM